MFIYILIYIYEYGLFNIFLNIAVCSNKGLELQSYIKSQSSHVEENYLKTAEKQMFFVSRSSNDCHYSFVIIDVLPALYSIPSVQITIPTLNYNAYYYSRSFSFCVV